MDAIIKNLIIALLHIVYLNLYINVTINFIKIL